MLTLNGRDDFWPTMKLNECTVKNKIGAAFTDNDGRDKARFGTAVLLSAVLRCTNKQAIAINAFKTF